MALQAKQELFVAQYLVDLNASAAAARAGYKHPNKQGPRLLANVEVAAAIQVAAQEQLQRAEVKAADVIKEASYVAFSSIGDVFDFSGNELKLRPLNEIPENARRAIASMKVRRYRQGRGAKARTVEVIEVTFWNKVLALDKLGQYLGLWGRGDRPSADVKVNINAEDFIEAKRRLLVSESTSTQQMHVT